MTVSQPVLDLACRVETFVRGTIVPYERDPRCGEHGPNDTLIDEMRNKARAAGLMTPHIRADGSHLTQRETAAVLRASGLSMLGPVALNTMAPTRAICICLVRSQRLNNRRISLHL